MGKTSVAGRAQLWQFRGNYELKGRRPSGVDKRLSQNLYEIRFSISLPGRADDRSLLYLPSPPPSFRPSLYLSLFTLSQIAGKRALSGCNALVGWIANGTKRGGEEKNRCICVATIRLYLYSLMSSRLSRYLGKIIRRCTLPLAILRAYKRDAMNTQIEWWILLKLPHSVIRAAQFESMSWIIPACLKNYVS